MAVQDNARERELCRIFNLKWDVSHVRDGIDATLPLDVDGTRYELDIEVKSSTGQSVSTARDVGMTHLARWRTMLFVIGFYSRSPVELTRCLCLTPLDLEPWIHEKEAYISTDFKLAELSANKLGYPDLDAVCGSKLTYDVKDAKKLHKLQWGKNQYAGAVDVYVTKKPTISRAKMLDILRLRSRYVSERGATLNNPHISKTVLKQFIGKDREIFEDHAAAIKKIAADFVRKNQGHPAVRIV